MNKEKALIILDSAELQTIEKSKAAQIKATFEPMAEMLLEFETAFDSVLADSEIEITEEITDRAKRLRIDIGKIRIKTEAVRKEQKDEYLRAGKAIDGVSNILKWAVVEKENKLKEIENHFEMQEQARVDKLQEDRVAKLSIYVADADERDLAGMDEDVWSAYFNAKKKEYEDIQAAVVQAEKDRIAKEKADIAEQKRIKAENEKLKKDAEAKLKADIEKQKREDAAKKLQEAKLKKEQEAQEVKLKKERELHEAELQKAKDAKIKIENDARIKQEKLEVKIKAEQDEKNRIAIEAEKKRVELENQIKAKEEAESAIKVKAEEARQFELNKGDSAKVQDLIGDLKGLKTKYVFQSKNNQETYSEVNTLIEKILIHIETKRTIK